MATIQSSSGFQSALVSDRMGRGALLLLAALAFACQFSAPSAAIADSILLIDRQRVLSDSDPARRLRAAEQERRTALRQQLDDIQGALEAEEAEISALRGQIDAAAFEARVQAFDVHVREARRRSQALGEALQSEFESARQRLVAALGPVLRAMLTAHEADVMLDVRSVLIARPGLDVTEEAIGRLNAATTTLFAVPTGE